MAGSLASLTWLTLGAFAIGTEGFMIAGLLPALAHDLDVGLPAAGHLVTAFSLAYAIGAPVLAVLTAGLERKRLLAVAMGGFALANLLAALAPGYAGLMGARLLLALSAARACCWRCPRQASCRRLADMPPDWGARSGRGALCPWSSEG
jgi:predicted MFS family arabinose efflux permease